MNTGRYKTDLVANFAKPGIIQSVQRCFLDGEAIDSAWIKVFRGDEVIGQRSVFQESLCHPFRTVGDTSRGRMGWFVESVFADNSPMGFRWMSAWDTTLLSMVWGVIPVIPRCSAGIRKYLPYFHLFFQRNSGGLIILIMFHP